MFFCVSTLAVVDGIGSADFDGGIEAVIGHEADVATGGDAEILASIEAGVGAGGGAKGGEGEGSGGGRNGLSMNQGAGNKGKAQQREGTKTGLQSNSLG